MAVKKKEPTLADVARRASVSAKTVSRVVNNTDYVSPETRLRILDAVTELSYLPNRLARSLASNRSAIIGVTIPDITNPFFPEVIRGIEQVALAHQYNAIIHNTDLIADRGRQALSLLEEMRVDGVIVCSMQLSDDALREFLVRQRHAVLINRTLTHDRFGIVRVDFVSAMERVTRHLLERGRQRIGYLTIRHHDSSYSAQKRFQGFTQALDAYGMAVDPEWVHRTAATVEDSFRETMTMLDAHPEMDAIICFNDLIASGVIEACIRRGVRVPDQVAITGFDDVMFSSLLRVPLTTVHVPKLDLGIQAAQMLFDMIEGGASEREVVLEAELVVRESAP